MQVVPESTDRIIVILQNPMRRTFQILELPAVHRPPENNANKKDKD